MQPRPGTIPSVTPSPTPSKDEVKSDSNPNSETDDHEVDDTELYYLNHLEERRLNKLIKKFDKSAIELDALIAQHKYYYYACRTENIIAISLNFLELAYLIEMSREGIDATMGYFFPELSLSNDVIYGIGIPWALTDFFLYLFVYSPYYEALKSTITYATQKPIRQRTSDYVNNLLENPKNQLINSIKYTVHQFVLLSCNTTESLTDIIEFLAILKKLPPTIYISTIMTVLYFGNLYYSKYVNHDYHEGLKFWSNQNKLPYLYQELLDKNILLPLQVFVQGCCAIGLDAYPFYYYLASTAQDELGFWIPAQIMLILSIIHGLCVLYPSTYHHYMDNHIKLDIILREQNNNTDLSIKKLTLAQTEQEQNYFYLFRHRPIVIIPILIRAAIGGYLGYLALNPLFLLIADDAISSALTSTIIGGGLLSTSLYRVEKYCLTTELAVKQLNNKEIKAANVAPTDCLPMSSKTIATFLNVGSGLANAASIIGAANQLIGSNSYFLPCVVFIAMERMSNGIIYNMDKVESTLYGAFSSTKKHLSNLKCSLFASKQIHPAPVAPLVPIEKSTSSIELI